MGPQVRIDRVSARAYSIPTDKPEADGTMAWDATTLVVAQVVAGEKTGLGYTYTTASAGKLIEHELAQAIVGSDAMDPPRIWRTMQRAVRNVGREGVAATAISALDIAIYDLKAKLLELPIALLLGRARDAVPIYGSGGFTTYSNEELRRQLSTWVERDGCAFVKMKIGAHPNQDAARVATAKAAIGQAALFVDANGAYTLKQALFFAQTFAENGVAWFEEPVSSDDLEGLRLLRRRAPACMDIAAGEYGYTLDYFRRMLSAEAVDVQQADVTRCGGITAFLRVAALCEAHHVDVSGHCAPAAHLHVACAAPRLRHLEWFHDHVRIERMLFDGAPAPKNGSISPDLSRPGLGLEFKRKDAERYAL